MAKFLTFQILEKRDIVIKVDDEDDSYPPGTPQETGQLVKEAINNGMTTISELEYDLWSETRTVDSVELKYAGTEPPKEVW